MISLGALGLAFIRFVSTPIGQVVVGVIGAAALFFTWLAVHDAKVAAKATTEIVSKLNTDAGRKVDAAVKAREPALRAGAFSRLRSQSCTNC
jgi:hypothetical protein